MSASALSLTTALGQSVEMPAFSATEVKNEFGRVLETAFTKGAVAITRHDAPKAVLLSLDAWRALTGAQAAPADPLAVAARELRGQRSRCSPACRRRRADRRARHCSTPRPMNSAPPP